MIISVLYLLVRCLLGCLTVLTRHRVSKDAELLVLRHENAVLRRQIGLGQRMATVRFLIRDRAGQFTSSFDAVFTAEGVRILASPLHAPRASAICERVIGTLRRELLDRLLIVNEQHLRRVLTEYLMHSCADGRPIRPEYLTHRFNTLVREFDLPPIRLHDLRHGAATLALASRTDLKVIQQMLGHSNIVTTADTYTSVLPETAHRSAQATADMVIKAACSAPGSRSSGMTVPHIPAAVTASGYCQI